MTLHVLAWLLLTAAAFYAIRMNLADAELQSFRRPEQPAAAYVCVPLRWKAHLYTEEGQPILARARQSMRRMYALALLGGLLLVLSGTI